MGRPSLMFNPSTCLITGISRHWYPIAGHSHILVSIRGSVHLIPGHPTINAEANRLFQEYQRQATSSEIQFRRWPLRAVSLACVYPHRTCILTLISTNVWFIILSTTPALNSPLPGRGQLLSNYFSQNSEF